MATISKIFCKYQRNDDKEGQSAEFPPVMTEAKHTAADVRRLYEDGVYHYDILKALKC